LNRTVEDLEKVKFPFEVKDYPIDQEVKGMQTIKLSIPIYIPEDFKQLESIMQVNLSFFGPKQTTFGQPFSV